MIISYPIMPGPSDDKTFSGYASASSGIYPASFEKIWHGGVHIHAHGQKVRAIADGVVVAYRKPTIVPTPEHEQVSHPLGYMSTKDNLKWTHDGFVLLKHETDTGENRPAVFYSLYMHLKELSSVFSEGKPGVVTCDGKTPIYRRDALGEAGKIYGKKDMFHFEIFVEEKDMRAADASCNAFSGLFNKKQSDDQLWGNLYFKIPESYGVYSYTEAALAKLRTTSGRSRHDNTLLQKPVYLKVTYHNGTRTNTTYTEEMLKDGLTYPLVGQTEEVDYEYDIWQKSKEICPSCASVGHDIARFGKVLTDTQDAIPSGLILRDWQHIMAPNGSDAICNLHSDTITRQSDADFPAWRGWTALEESISSGLVYFDGICDIKSLILKLAAINISDDVTGSAEGLLVAKDPALRLLSGRYDEWLASRNKARVGVFDGGEKVVILSKEAEEFMKELKKDFAPYVQKQLTYVVCKFPTEWSKTDNAKRYQRLKEPYFKNDKIAYADFLQHIEALQFWDDAGMGDTAVWHFHPLRFIAHFKKCGWRSANELAQMMPRQIFSIWEKTIKKSDGTKKKEEVHELATGAFPSALDKMKKYSTYLNKTMRRYGINSGQRQAAFLANGIQETNWLTNFYEEHPTNTAVIPWNGSGFIQFTWAYNYVQYFRFRGKPNLPTTDAEIRRWQASEANIPEQAKVWRDELALKQYASFDSAGFYWIWGMAHGSFGNKLTDEIESADTQIANTCDKKPVNFYANSGFERVCRFINTGNPNSVNRLGGAVERMSAYLYSRSVICDIEYTKDDGEIIYYPEYFFPTTVLFKPQRGN